MIEVDDDSSRRSGRFSTPRTLEATVDGAFNEVLALDRRRRALLAERGVEPDLLSDPAARPDAWG